MIEVLRLKENFSTITRSKESLAEENRQLKQLLAQHGIPWNGTGGVGELQQRNPSVGYTSSGSVSGSYAPGSTTYSPPPGSHSSNLNPNNMQYNHGSPPEFGASNNMNGRSMAQQQVQPGVDYDQAGIDFVLTLERPCMDHMQFLMERSSDPEGEIWCGHALMATCPPEVDMEQHPDIPFGHCLPHVNKPESQKTWDLSKSDLSNLLDLSKRLDLNGEITPVMAWGMVLAHPRLSELKEKDFKAMSEDLLPKVRCYGYVPLTLKWLSRVVLTDDRFGAALEEFEVRDALQALFSTDTSPGVMHYMS
ncbi:bZIP-type transcription factor protein [Rutstroemia sp. NJR-2017a BVV2]|nr:bZIP-type transcription factor protein [Rutstroemia sp. NJR-2017a BVV2]PQE18483.1 bZIP-type transcription factor protein [Rutstroemia sp. NJR-2017a BVV2]